VFDAPMLRDEVWHKLADADERFLCADCMFDSAETRGVALSIASLRPCPFNLFHRPKSWFNLFMRGETEPPANLAEWEAIAEYNQEEFQ
jgi:hypothetical protein